jgi:hypothetical protein
MSPSTPTQPDSTLRAVLVRPEVEAGRLLASAGPEQLAVVAWLSAHLAALDHAVEPALRRAVPEGEGLVAAHRAVARRLMRCLRAVERHHSGDVLAAGLSPDKLDETLRRLVGEHREVESQLIDVLSRALSPADQAALVETYEHALSHAPTRPHPHTSHGALMFRLDGIRDRILDAMDGRTVPVPRRPRARIMPGRWGAYLLGEQHESAPPDAG